MFDAAAHRGSGFSRMFDAATKTLPVTLRASTDRVVDRALFKSAEKPAFPARVRLFADGHDNRAATSVHWVRFGS